MLQNNQARVPQVLKPECPGPVPHSRRSHCGEEPVHQSSPRPHS